MLCRVLCVAAVVSYVLCVLLLSGVQKEELDAGTLRKLQRHNVNIDAIGDRKQRSQCLTEKNSDTTLSTLQVTVDDEAKSTMKPITLELDTQTGDRPTQWNKLFAYFKQQNGQNVFHLKETTIKSIIIQSDSNIDTLPSPMRGRFVEGIIDKGTKIPENIVKNNNEEKARYDLRNSDKSQIESSTANDNTMKERSNDVEYISKIVAEILSQRQPKQVQTSTVLPMRTFNANKLIKDIDKVLEENKINEAPLRTNYSLNNTVAVKQENAPNENRGNKEGREIFEDFLNQLHNPISNIRESFINNIQMELKEGKVTLYNAPDKLSDMLSITNNEPNNLLYVVDSQSTKPIDSESLADQKVDVFNQLSERDKAIICKSNNEIHLIQKEIYRNICPYDQNSKLTGAASSEEQINIQFNRQNERHKISHSKSLNENGHYSNDNKSIWPYFIVNQNNGKDLKLEMEHNSLDIKLPSDRYDPIKADEPSEDNTNKSKWPYFLERQRNTEQQKLYRGNQDILFNRLNDQEQTTNLKSKTDKANIKTFENPLYPLGFANHPNGDNHYKTEWDFNVQSAKEFEPKLEREQEIPTFVRPHAGEFKNTWPYYLEGNRITQNPMLVDKNALYQVPPDREMLLNNHRSDPKSLNWYEIKGHDMKNNKSNGTLGYNAKEQPKSTILDETTNAKHNIDPNNYETINWPYLIERQKSKHDLIAIEENKKEPLYIRDNKIPKHNTYEYALSQKDGAYNNRLMNAEARSDLYQQYIVTEKPKNERQKEDNEKVNSLPPNVLKEIANTVKQIVLKDLKMDTPVTSTTATPITSTTRAPTTTITTTTVTSSTTTTTPVPINVITTTEPKTTTNTPSTSVKEDHMKIEEASQALKNFMALFEKFNLMKNGNQHLNTTQNRDNITQTQRAEAIATVPTIIRNPYAPYKFNAPLLPPMSQYGKIRSPYLQTKAMALDPYLQKIIQVPATMHNNALDNIHTVGRSVHALTFQTNSNEIKPLKIPVSKGMIVDNIVLSPKPLRDRGRPLREYSEETYRYRKPNKYNQRNEYGIRSNRSRDSYFKFDERPKPRSMKKEYGYDRFYKARSNYEGVKFHEKLENEDNWLRGSVEGKCGSKEGCNDRVVSRQQRPLINIASTYDDTHFRNFLKTQQKVNDMLERILATKTKHSRRSGEVI